jgi:hypothetical protein
LEITMALKKFSQIDFNGDGTADLLFRVWVNGVTNVWDLNPGGSLGPVQSYQPVPLDWNVIDAHGDYNGDGKSDILWYNTLYNAVTTWQMNGTQIAANPLFYFVPSIFTIADGHADYDGDGTSDILWRNNSNGAVVEWRMSGGQIAQVTLLDSPPTSYSTIDTHGDYNGDGRSDILWRGEDDGTVAIWQMNGSQRGPVAGWYDVPLYVSIVDGHGDFNGDGKSDILWYNDGTGQVVAWLMNGFQRTVNVLTTQPNTLQIVDAHGDYNRDGTSDILVRDTSTGDVSVWLMSNGAISSNNLLYPGIGSQFQIVDGHSDYNQDGRSDILWRDTSNDETVQWFLTNDGRHLLTVQDLGAMTANRSIDTSENGALILFETLPTGTWLRGTDANDRINLGSGSAINATGGAGADQFIFQSLSGAFIFDFVPGIDKIVLDHNIWPILPVGAVTPSQFSVSELGPFSGNPDILYISGRGELDINHNGSLLAIAALPLHLALSASDFLVI